MVKRTLNAIAICLLSATLFTNCAKTGPQGEKGDTGAAGAAGNANVKSSTSGNLLWTYNALNARYEAVINNTAITQDIVNNGAVLVAAETSNGNWSQMPFSTMANASVALFFDYDYFVNGVRVSIQNTDYDNSLSPVNTLRFKVTVMAGTARPAKDYNTNVIAELPLATAEGTE